jgi:hypothetical protein
MRQCPGRLSSPHPSNGCRSVGRQSLEQVAYLGVGQSAGDIGWLQVAGIGSGASEVTVHLSFFDDSHDPGEQTVHEPLDTSLQRLEARCGCASTTRLADRRAHDMPLAKQYAVATSGQRIEGAARGSVLAVASAERITDPVHHPHAGGEQFVGGRFRGH